MTAVLSPVTGSSHGHSDELLAKSGGGCQQHHQHIAGCLHQPITPLGVNNTILDCKFTSFW